MPDIYTIAQEVFNVKIYGALGNNSADDSNAINQAILAATPTNGIVYFPGGRYRGSNILRNPACSYLGDSKMSTIIKPAIAGAPIFKTTRTGLSDPYEQGFIRDIQFDGEFSATIGIESVGEAYFKWEGCSFFRFTDAAITLFGTLSGALTNCYFRYNVTGVRAKFNITQTVQPNLMSFYNCWFLEHSKWALDWEKAAGVHLDKCDFEGNGTPNDNNTGSIRIFRPCPTGEGVAVTLDKCWFESGRGVNLDIINAGGYSRTIVRDTHMMYESNTYGIRITGGSGTGGPPQVNKLFISGSNIIGHTYDVYGIGAAVEIEEEASNLQTVTVVNNATHRKFTSTLNATGAAGDITVPTITAATRPAANRVQLTFSEAVFSDNAGWIFRDSANTSLTLNLLSGFGTNTLLFEVSGTATQWQYAGGWVTDIAGNTFANASGTVV